MKKGSRKIARTSARQGPITPARGAPRYEGLGGEIGVLLEEARRTSARAVNAIMTTTYWEIGRRIVEYEQQGSARAEYGEALLKRLAVDLTSRHGRGFGWRNLFQMRAFYLTYPPAKLQTMSAISEGSTGASPVASGARRKLQTASAESEPATVRLASRFPLPGLPQNLWVENEPMYIHGRAFRT